LKNPFHNLYHPEIFQGHLRKKKYFEGWYVKLVSPEEEHALAVIPGVALYDQTDRHAFIQVIDGIRQETSYHRFSLDTFSADRNEFNVRIGANTFSRHGVTLDLPELSGQIQFQDTTPLASSLFNPGIMGWYSFVPTMECYHGIVSLHHSLHGKTSGLAGEIDWTGGIGYMEKDWGISFPRCWIWMHTNHFHNDASPASLMASVAHIPWKGNYFPGFIVVLYVHGKEYRFATYNGSRMKCRVGDTHVQLQFKRGSLYLEINAERGPTATLRSPITGRMTGKVNESLQAIIQVVLKKGDDVLWEATGTSAGLEVAGDTGILETEDWRK
jgi:hypothetical protein